MTHGSGLYKRFIHCCELAGVETRRVDELKGHEIDHVDLHSLRRTFATDLIERNVDPKRVQELLGHKTLAITMDLYAKVRRGTLREAIGRLSYARDAESTEAPEIVPEKGLSSRPCLSD